METQKPISLEKGLPSSYYVGKHLLRVAQVISNVIPDEADYMRFSLSNLVYAAEKEDLETIQNRFKVHSVKKLISDNTWHSVKGSKKIDFAGMYKQPNSTFKRAAFIVEGTKRFLDSAILAWIGMAELYIPSENMKHLVSSKGISYVLIRLLDHNTFSTIKVDCTIASKRVVIRVDGRKSPKKTVKRRYGHVVENNLEREVRADVSRENSSSPTERRTTSNYERVKSAASIVESLSTEPKTSDGLNFGG